MEDREPLSASIAWFNQLPAKEAADAVLKCCHSSQLAALVVGNRPFNDFNQLVHRTRTLWLSKVGIPGWLEAFGGHPRIGDVEGLREKFGASAEFSEGEQGAALASAKEDNLQELAAWNKDYEEKFGHVFLICASGKSSVEVLAALKSRFSSTPHEEIRIAAVEQQKITELRLEKLLSSQIATGESLTQKSPLTASPAAAVSEARTEAPSPLSPQNADGDSEARQNMRGSAQGRLAQIGGHLTAGRGPGILPEHGLEDTPSAGAEALHRLSMQPTAAAGGPLRSPITTHVLDLSHGRPAHGVAVELEVMRHDSWQMLGHGATDADGRVIDLLHPSDEVEIGVYKLRFETGRYLRHLQRVDRGDPGRVGADGGFYPLVEIVFDVKATQTREHFHVPLILSPYSYTTYRGS